MGEQLKLLPEIEAEIEKLSLRRSANWLEGTPNTNIVARLNELYEMKRLRLAQLGGE